MALGPVECERLVSRVQALARRKKLFYKGKDCHPLSLVPLVLPRQVLPALKSVTRAVYRLQRRAPRLHRDNALGFAEIVKPQARTESWLRQTLSPRTASSLLLRPDFGLALENGIPKPFLYESNSLLLASLYNQPMAQEILESLPELGRRHGLKAPPDLLLLFKNWISPFCRPAQGEAIAFLEKLPVAGGFSEIPRIVDSLRKTAMSAVHADPRELELCKEKVFLGGKPIAFAYRDFSFEELGGPRNPSLKAFRRLWEEGRVAPGFAADFAPKSLLEVLTSSRYHALFSKRELSLFREHVPWTRAFGERRTESPEGKSVDLPEYVLKTRENLVLKPAWGAGGERILIGPRAAPGKWREALGKALERPGGFVVQEYREGLKLPMAYLRQGRIRFKDCGAIIGVFFGGRGFGFASRIGPGEIVNVARGGAVCPVLFG